MRRFAYIEGYIDFNYVGNRGRKATKVEKDESVDGRKTKAKEGEGRGTREREREIEI